jgi:uncharacterized membrane protein
MDRGRLEAFSDGVFAVAITLLALGLSVKGPGHGPLARQLADSWAALVAYVISFFTIGIIWVNHHALVSNIVAVDRVLLFLNLVLLLFVVMIPFATGTVADYHLSRVGFDSRVAVAVYGVVLTGMSAGFASMFEWSLRAGSTRTRLPRDQWWSARRRFTVGIVVYLAVIGVAFASPPVAFGLTGAVAVYYVFERTPAVPAASENEPGPELRSTWRRGELGGAGWLGRALECAAQPGQEGGDRGTCDLAQHQPVKAGAQGAQRRPVGAGQAHPGTLAVGAEDDVRVQDGKQRAGHPDRLPAQPDAHLVVPVGGIGELDAHQP